MIKSRIKIGTDEVCDITEQFGFIYLNGDKRFAAPIKDFEKTSYPEQAGYNILPKTVDDGFEYKVELFVKADRIENANKKIATFNNSLYSRNGDVKTFKQISFYDDYKGVVIVGYPQPIQEATEFWRDSKGQQLDIVCVEFVIIVNNPNLCQFYIDKGYSVYFEKTSLHVNGNAFFTNNAFQINIPATIEETNLIFK